MTDGAVADPAAVLAAQGRLLGDLGVEELVDVLWGAGAPSREHLVVERGWAPKRFEQWVVRLARGFVGGVPT